MNYEKIPIPTIQEIITTKEDMGEVIDEAEAKDILEQIIRDWATNTKLALEGIKVNPYAISETEFEAEYKLLEVNRSEKFHNSLKVLTIKANITN